MTNVIKIPELSLVVLVGASGSGKSSFARKHFLSTEILSSDFCRAMISDDENDQSCSEDAFDVLHYIAATRMRRGKLTVIDATNIYPQDRAKLIKLARQNYFLPVAIVLDLPWQTCHDRNRERADRQFGKHVVIRHTNALRKGLRSLRKQEGFTNVTVLSSVAEIDAVTIERQPLWNNKKDITGPFDIIGDVHGCFDELIALLAKLGYSITQSDGSYALQHPDDRKVIFVGDLVDRGPKTPEVLRLAMDTVTKGQAFCVVGNHDDKLKRTLMGNKVKVAHGLQASLDQLAQESETFRTSVKDFLGSLISHYVFDRGNLAVAHAGIKEKYLGRGAPRIKQFCMYGETTGEVDQFGLPVRYPWAEDYRGDTMIVYGHTPIPEPEWVNNTINIDTGCVFGGHLTALRYPEKELVSVVAKQVYMEPIKPLSPITSRSAYELLDINDVSGKRILHPELCRSITIREENAAAALETISRFASDPRWLVYLPPTMSPTETSQKEGYLEHPEEAFKYFRTQGIEQVICEEKHMGSRAIVVVCRDSETAAKRFHVDDGAIGICYTRTGRPFFSDRQWSTEFIDRVNQAITKANLWEELKSDWLVLDAELMPWSAKAQNLIEHQYAPVAVAAEVSLGNAIELLNQASDRLPEALNVETDLRDRLHLAQQYRQTYQNYCWTVNSLSDYKLAPFHILAHERSHNLNRDHQWHMELIEKLANADPGLFQATKYEVVALNDQNDCEQAIAWWEQMTASGGEGMVVKPLAFTQRGAKGLVQPGIKCRGVEYLRIIYGLEYTKPEHLDRLRQRGLGKKRSLAIREYALGYEALKHFVNQNPLHKVHECVFGILALESEPVDPRL
jgi:protein phosphatase